MSGEDKEPERSFKVEDRRRFSDTGEARPDVEDREAPTAENTEPSPEKQTSGGPGAGEHAAHGKAPEINFATFVISLSTQALVHLGEIPDPVDRSARVDLSAARQIIDILGILREKTKGNLDSAEGRLIEDALYDLRVKYVERAQSR
jgi:hypothetical protein